MLRPKGDIAGLKRGLSSPGVSRGLPASEGAVQNESEEYRSASAGEPSIGLPRLSLRHVPSSRDLGDVFGGPARFSELLPGAMNSGGGAPSNSPSRGLAMGVQLVDGVLQNESE